jgi:hypothetical protein
MDDAERLRRPGRVTQPARLWSKAASKVNQGKPLIGMLLRPKAGSGLIKSEPASRLLF